MFLLPGQYLALPDVLDAGGHLVDAVLVVPALRNAVPVHADKVAAGTVGQLLAERPAPAGDAAPVLETPAILESERKS